MLPTDNLLDPAGIPSSGDAVQGSLTKRRGGRKSPEVQDIAEGKMLLTFALPQRGHTQHQHDPSGEIQESLEDRCVVVYTARLPSSNGWIFVDLL